jgi:hypothetical protein
MNYFEINMECMKQYRAKLFQLLQDSNQYLHINKLDLIQSDPAINGELFLTVRKETKLYRLVSCYNPRNEADQWVGQYDFMNMKTVITQFGFGTGSFIQAILNKKGKDDILFVYEPCPELFIHVLHNYDITDIIKENKVVLVVEGINDFEFHILVRNALDITNITSQIRYSHPGYEKVFPESCLKYWKDIKDGYIHVKTNINTVIYFGKRYITNALFNTRFIRESNRLMELKADFNTDIPAIVVAAGPSLKKNIEELKRAKGRAYIFVVDRALDYVLDEGLEPDFVVTIDPMKPLEYFTKRTDLTIPLLCDAVSNWEILDRHKGKKILFNCFPYYRLMYQRLGKEAPLLAAGASVATAAFCSCIQLGFKTIALVGQDLAYDGEFSHAGDVTEQENRNRDILVEGIDGSQIRSRADWYEFLIWFQDVITLNPDLKVIDTKDKGAKIKGSIIMPLSEVIDNYCTETLHLKDSISKKQHTFSDDDMIQVKQFFEESYEELPRLKRKAKEAIELCESQIRKFKVNHEETTTTQNNFKKISKINKYISEQPVYHLLESFITTNSAQQVSQLYQFSGDKKTDKIVTYEKSISVFRAIVDGIEFVKPLFEEALEHI